MELITLSKTRFLYLSLALLIIVGLVVLVVSPASGGLWCRQFEMPAYEKRFGFKLGSLEVHDSQRSTYSAIGIVWVAPEGVFARAGVKAGDVRKPRLPAYEMGRCRRPLAGESVP
jgi:hypothetical protein